jgi:hypothetical protein
VVLVRGLGVGTGCVVLVLVCAEHIVDVRGGVEQEGVVEAAERFQDGALAEGELVEGAGGASLVQCGVDGVVQLLFGVARASSARLR